MEFLNKERALETTTTSPPGLINGESAPEKDGSKFAADDDANVNYNNNTTNQNPQLCADGLPKIVPIQEFEAHELDPPKVLDPCDKCFGEMAEPVEIEHVRAQHPDWQPGPICHCYDDEDGSAVQVCLAAVARCGRRIRYLRIRFLKR